MNNLKQLRKEKRLTQQEVAFFIGISQNNYSYWENDKVKIDNSSLSKLAEFFNVSIDYLLGRTDNRNFAKISQNDNATINENTVVSIGRDGKRVVYSLSDEDARFVDIFLEKLLKKS